MTPASKGALLNIHYYYSVDLQYKDADQVIVYIRVCDLWIYIDIIIADPDL